MGSCSTLNDWNHCTVPNVVFHVLSWKSFASSCMHGKVPTPCPPPLAGLFICFDYKIHLPRLIQPISPSLVAMIISWIRDSSEPFCQTAKVSWVRTNLIAYVATCYLHPMRFYNNCKIVKNGKIGGLIYIYYKSGPQLVGIKNTAQLNIIVIVNILIYLQTIYNNCYCKYHCYCNRYCSNIETGCSHNLSFSLFS